jgi:hypothetical protein
MPDNLLEEDTVKVSGQNFALVSFVSPTSAQKHEKYGLKIRGCFDTKEEAQAFVKRIMDADATFNVYLVDMYRWLLIPPDDEQIENHVYQEDFLNDMVSGYKESNRQAKALFEQRKKDVIKDGLDAHLLPEERVPILEELDQPDIPGPSKAE